MPVPMETTDSENDKKKAIKEIYNDSVRLLELLNVIIPKLDTYNPNISESLIREISDKCFELGGNLATSGDELTEKKTDDDEYDYANYPCGM